MWDTSKALRYPMDTKIVSLPEVPYTISFVIRKRQQLDNIYELPKEKRPGDDLIWDGTADELDKWYDGVFKGKINPTAELIFSDNEIEE